VSQSGRYQYNELSEQFRSGLDMDNSGDLGLSGADRVTESDTCYRQDGSSNWWRRSVSVLYAADGSDAPTTNSVQETLLTGLSASMTSKSVSRDILGNETVGRIGTGNLYWSWLPSKRL
jgi:hypothetical protein